MNIGVTAMKASFPEKSLFLKSLNRLSEKMVEEQDGVMKLRPVSMTVALEATIGKVTGSWTIT